MKWNNVNYLLTKWKKLYLFVLLLFMGGEIQPLFGNKLCRISQIRERNKTEHFCVFFWYLNIDKIGHVWIKFIVTGTFVAGPKGIWIDIKRCIAKSNTVLSRLWGHFCYYNNENERQTIKKYRKPTFFKRKILHKSMHNN